MLPLLNNCPFTPSSSSSLSLLHTHHLSIPQICRISRTVHNQRPFSLSFPSASHTSLCFCSKSSIFLPLLQEDQNPQIQEPDEEQPSEKGEILDTSTKRYDPIVRFFMSRTAKPDPDPGREGKISLQKNRKSSWHLAFERDDSVEEDEESKEIDDNDFHVGNNLKASASIGKSSSEACGVVGEILEKTRNLPENLTLTEVLGGFEGRVGLKECVEVLELMGAQGLTRGCLYFFEWMRLSEPSLVSPRACSVLFPYLGRAGRGDEIMTLFRNLPNEKRYRNVHVYNAAISGLLSCSRYLFFHLFLLFCLPVLITHEFIFIPLAMQWHHLDLLVLLDSTFKNL